MTLTPVHEGKPVHPLERRIAKLEPPLPGNKLHVVRADTRGDAHKEFEAIRVGPGDLCIWLKRFGESLPAPTPLLQANRVLVAPALSSGTKTGGLQDSLSPTTKRSG